MDRFPVGPEPGILDWYTVLTGVVALAVLALHGSTYLALKTEGELNARARKAARVLWAAVTALTLVSLIATLSVRPQMLLNYSKYPIGAVIPLVVLVSLGLIAYYLSKRSEKAAFLASSVYIAAMLVGAAFGLYPNVLPASTKPEYSLTVQNTAAPAYGLGVGLVWWTIGLVLTLGYFTFVYRMFKGKVKLSTDGHGY